MSEVGVRLAVICVACLAGGFLWGWFTANYAAQTRHCQNCDKLKAVLEHIAEYPECVSEPRSQIASEYVLGVEDGHRCSALEARKVLGKS